MKRPARREMARQQAKELKVKLRDFWPQFRQNGSLRPFHRINALVEGVVKSKDKVERAAAQQALSRSRLDTQLRENGMRTTLSHVVFWTASAIVILLMIFLGMPAKAGELYSVTTVRSYHVDREAKYNEKNYGIGLEYQFNKSWAVAAGEYKNSFFRRSGYYGAIYTPFVEGNFKAGLMLLNVSGYDTKDLRRYQPVAVPTVMWESKGFGVNTVFVPPIGNKTGVLGVQIKFNVVGF